MREEGSKYHYNRTIIGVSLACRCWPLNVVSLACRWRPYIECWLGSTVIFKGIRTSTCIAKKFCSFVIFWGWGADMLCHNKNLEISLTFKKANIADLNKIHRTLAPHSGLLWMHIFWVDKPYLPINKHAILDPIQCGCVRWFVSFGVFLQSKWTEIRHDKIRDVYWIQTDGLSYIWKHFLKKVKFKKEKKKGAYKIMSMLRVQANALNFRKRD